MAIKQPPAALRIGHDHEPSYHSGTAYSHISISIIRIKTLEPFEGDVWPDYREYPWNEEEIISPIQAYSHLYLTCQLDGDPKRLEQEDPSYAHEIEFGSYWSGLRFNVNDTSRAEAMVKTAKRIAKATRDYHSSQYRDEDGYSLPFTLPRRAMALAHAVKAKHFVFPGPDGRIHKSGECTLKPISQLEDFLTELARMEAIRCQIRQGTYAGNVQIETNADPALDYAYTKQVAHKTDGTRIVEIAARDAQHQIGRYWSGGWAKLILPTAA